MGKENMVFAHWNVFVLEKEIKINVFRDHSAKDINQTHNLTYHMISLFEKQKI